jgi:hypothetical protein
VFHHAPGCGGAPDDIRLTARRARSKPIRETLRAARIGTCRPNDVEPLAYLTATLEAVAHGHPGADIDALMTWAFAAGQAKSEARIAALAANDRRPPRIDFSSPGKGMGRERRLRPKGRRPSGNRSTTNGPL